MYTNKYICIKGICPGFKLSEKKTEFSLVNFLWEVFHLVRTYVGVRNNSFSENFVYYTLTLGQVKKLYIKLFNVKLYIF